MALTLILPLSLTAQKGLGVEELMNEGRPRYQAENLIIKQDPAIDTLISHGRIHGAAKEQCAGFGIRSGEQQVLR